ncbi:hypothetical protein [Bordetella pseudohinzii]|uniref:Uncharacterized protein n=1 Tax=Bordetella pseudohinzii TaxID=1331258 RepID=A0A0J6C6C9_9BORD|nr:hypothetical protein [Bordetella pseudohinzii]ANY17244.1 hypothetical protein BBN53_15985 [Bordetella pseudohinzii]KMM24862.1 hypothetical protein L540_03270 [Bordetella pseudohinzii]KXA75364.1 hypothetical protein AW877_20205 [Bordetella pseudohinzii]KXA75566.1 hypothetical protein AW878_19860 [Bordetella pseudohinzii]CUI96953.1 Uncharacterised protein [Bordetella pseudohinzii]
MNKAAEAPAREITAPQACAERARNMALDNLMRRAIHRATAGAILVDDLRAIIADLKSTAAPTATVSGVPMRDGDSVRAAVLADRQQRAGQVNLHHVLWVLTGHEAQHFGEPRSIVTEGRAAPAPRPTDHYE